MGRRGYGDDWDLVNERMHEAVRGVVRAMTEMLDRAGWDGGDPDWALRRRSDSWGEALSKAMFH